MSHNLAQCQTLVRKAVTAGAKVGLVQSTVDAEVPCARH